MMQGTEKELPIPFTGCETVIQNIHEFVLWCRREKEWNDLYKELDDLYFVYACTKEPKDSSCPYSSCTDMARQLEQLPRSEDSLLLFYFELLNYPDLPINDTYLETHV